MNPTEIYAVHVELLAVFNSIFEIWLGFTFAALVAFHLAAASINKYMLSAALILYTVASGVFAMRHMLAAITFGELNEKLVAAGYEPYPEPPAAVPIAVQLIFLFGTISTVWYSIYRHRSNRDATQRSVAAPHE